MKIKKYISSNLAQFKQWILSVISNRVCFHNWEPSKIRWNSQDCKKCGKHKTII